MKTKVKVQVIQRAPDGKFLPGSAGSPGRPKLNDTRFDRLLQSVSRVESRLNKNLLDHYVARAFESDLILVSVMRKLVPDLAAIGYLDLNQEMDNSMAEAIRQKLLARANEHSEIAEEQQ